MARDKRGPRVGPAPTPGEGADVRAAVEAMQTIAREADQKIRRAAESVQEATNLGAGALAGMAVKLEIYGSQLESLAAVVRGNGEEGLVSKLAGNRVELGAMRDEVRVLSTRVAAVADRVEEVFAQAAQGRASNMATLVSGFVSLVCAGIAAWAMTHGGR